MPYPLNVKALLAQAAGTAAALLLATSANATLLGRDISGNAVANNNASAVFFYDTDLNITWLRNANAGAGSSFDNGSSTTDGRMTWANANNWANTLTVGSYAGWRVPTMVDTGALGCNYSNAGGTDCGYNVQTATSEMAHLYYVSLGNLAYCPPGDATCAGGPQTGFGLTNIGDFQNLEPEAYWYGTDDTTNPTVAWRIHTFNGEQYIAPKGIDLKAMAVRPGDVLAPINQVPEPGTLLLTAAVLLGLGLARRGRGNSQG